MVSLPSALFYKAWFYKACEDQSLFTRFVKGLGHNAAITCGVLPFLTQAAENAAFTGCLLAKSQQLWPVLLCRF
jgi:hypothetical protein